MRLIFTQTCIIIDWSQKLDIFIQHMNLVYLMVYVLFTSSSQRLDIDLKLALEKSANTNVTQS